MAGSSRRSISIRGSLHACVGEYCRTHGIAVSAFVESLIEARLDKLIPKPEPVALVPVKAPKAPKKSKAKTSAEPELRVPEVAKKPTMRPTPKPMKALPPRSEVQMPLQVEGPMQGYISPLQNW